MFLFEEEMCATASFVVYLCRMGVLLSVVEIHHGAYTTILPKNPRKVRKGSGSYYTDQCVELNVS